MLAKTIWSRLQFGDVEKTDLGMGERGVLIRERDTNYSEVRPPAVRSKERTHWCLAGMVLSLLSKSFVDNKIKISVTNLKPK